MDLNFISEAEQNKVWCLAIQAIFVESGLSDAHMHVLSFYPMQVPEIKKMAQTLHVQFL